MRGNTKIGDIFCVRFDNSKKYFQYIISDLTQLNSDVIRAFTKSYSIHEEPELSEIVQGEVSFYAHCVTKLGLKMNLWERVGNTSEVGDTKDILFRDSYDYGYPEIKVSQKWYVWKINEPDVYVGKLTPEYQHAEIGIVVAPHNIVERIITGVYPFKGYPEY